MNEISVSSTLEVLLDNRFYVLTRNTYWYNKNEEYNTDINIIYDNKIYQVIQRVNKGENPDTNPEKFKVLEFREILSENVITEQINESNKLIQELKQFDITQAIPRLEALENRNIIFDDTITKFKQETENNFTELDKSLKTSKTQLQTKISDISTNLQNTSDTLNAKVDTGLNSVTNMANYNKQQIEEIKEHLENIPDVSAMDNHIKDTSIHFTKEEVLREATSNVVTTGYDGQLLSIKNNKPSPKNPITFVNLKMSEDELQLALASKPLTLSDVFSTWTKFAHLPNYNQTISGTALSEVNAWRYNSSLNAIQNSVNTTAFVGFLRPEPKQNWRLKIRGKGTDSDNDYFAIIIGYLVDEHGVQHTLSLLRTYNNTEHAKTGLFSLVYDFNSIANWDGLVIMNETSQIKTQGVSWTKPTLIQVTRKGNYIKCETGESNGSTLTASFEYTLPTEKPEAWTDEQFNNITKMLSEPSQMGFGMCSQPGYFQLLETDGIFDNSDIFDGINNVVYKFNNTSNKWENSGKISDNIGNYTICFDKKTKVLAYCVDDELVILNS